MDTWFIARILICWCFPEDHEKVNCVVRHRHNEWITNARVLERSDIFEGKAFYERLRACPVFSPKSFHLWLENDIRDHQQHPLHECLSFIGSKVLMDRTKKKLYGWLHFCQSKDVQVYYDEHEQIGLLASVDLLPQALVDCGAKVNHWIGKRSRHIHQINSRWSTIENVYIGGGMSLINHACEKHANVFIDFMEGSVITIRRICENEPLRACYGEDSEVLKRTRYVECQACCERPK